MPEIFVVKAKVNSLRSVLTTKSTGTDWGPIRTKKKYCNIWGWRQRLKTSRVCVAPAASANLLSLNDGRQWIVAGLVCLDPDVPVDKQTDEQVPYSIG